MPPPKKISSVDHAEYFARAVTHCWDTYDASGFDTALGWIESNTANLRSGFRWALDRGEIVLATALAAHAAQMMIGLQQTEPIGWVEEALPAAIAADVPQLPRLLTAATLCAYIGRAQDALDYSARAMELEIDPRYDPYEFGMASIGHSNAHLFIGNLERSVEICTDLAKRTGFARRIGLAGLLNQLPGLGRGEEARALADDALHALREQDTPFWLAYTLLGYARAFAETDPPRAMRVLQEAVTYTQEHRLPFWEAIIIREAATMEALHGDRDRALELFDGAIASQHRDGNVAHVAASLASVAVCFDQLGQPDTAATIYGSSTPYGSLSRARGLRQTCQHLADTLGQAKFEDLVAQGAAMGLAEAVHYARHHIQLARHQSPPSGTHTVAPAGSVPQPAE